MSGKTEVGPTEYSTTIRLSFWSVLFFGRFFGLTRRESAIDHLHVLSGEISFGLVKVSSLQDLLSSEIVTLLGKTVNWLKTCLNPYIYGRSRTRVKGCDRNTCTSSSTSMRRNSGWNSLNLIFYG